MADNIKTDKFKDMIFEPYKYQITEIYKHYEDCQYINRTIPINECHCDCYVKQVFDLGRKAEKDLFYI